MHSGGDEHGKADDGHHEQNHHDGVGEQKLHDGHVGSREHGRKGGDAEGHRHPEIDLLHVDGNAGARVALHLVARSVIHEIFLPKGSMARLAAILLRIQYDDKASFAIMQGWEKRKICALDGRGAFLYFRWRRRLVTGVAPGLQNQCQAERSEVGSTPIRFRHR